MDNIHNRTLNNLNELFIHEIQDLYSAETQLLETLPKLVDATSNTTLKKELKKHLTEVTSHKERLEQIGKLTNTDMEGNTCEAMEGLVEEAKEILFIPGEAHVKDAAIIGQVQRFKHYEIAGYGTTAALARNIDVDDQVIKLLDQIKDDEQEEDTMLNAIALGEVNQAAV